LWGYLRERDHFEDLGLYGRIILKCILKNWDGEALDGVDVAKKWDRLL
jgi:hypothetical protein